MRNRIVALVALAPVSGQATSRVPGAGGTPLAEVPAGFGPGHRQDVGGGEIAEVVPERDRVNPWPDHLVGVAVCDARRQDRPCPEG